MDESQKEMAVILVAVGAMVVMLGLAMNPDFNIWLDVQDFNVTPDRTRAWENVKGVPHLTVVERGRMGVFYLVGNIPEAMDPGVTYGISGQVGYYGHRRNRALNVYRVQDWWVVEG